MCGIAGFIDFKNSLDQKDLVEMTDTLRHRGPDGSGYEIWNFGTSRVGLGHRRLSIIDISAAGSQPMIYNDIALIFNGELYNYKEIKKILEAEGYPFHTSSDTEVVIQAFRKWGRECVHRFIGMFSFLILDIKKRELYIFRDRSGVKPLYLYEKNGLFLFASELKAFHACKKFEKELDPRGVTSYFKYGFIPAPLSIFKNVKKVLPGHYMKLNLENGELNQYQYWNAKDFVHNKSCDDINEFKGELKSLLSSAFNYRMVADVPVGVFLSGGYDSSLVTAVLQKDATQKVKTFNIGFEDASYDESGYADEVAKYLGTDHTSVICGKKEAQDIVTDLPYYYDEPFADSSSIPTFLVSRIAAKHVKVALSADGGDEIFGGYARNLKYIRIKEKLDKIPKFLQKSVSQSFSWAYNLPGLSVVQKGRMDRLGDLIKHDHLYEIFDTMTQYTSMKQRQSWLNPSLFSDQFSIGDYYSTSNGSEINKMLSLDFQSTLTNDMLVKVDRATMANSLEGREPLMDHRIYEFMAGAPESLKINNGKLKYLLKEITHEYIPESIMNRPKKGFGIPISFWLKNELSHLVDEYLNEEALSAHDIFQNKAVSKIIKEHRQFNNSNDQLWQFLNFQMWYKTWM